MWVHLDQMGKGYWNYWKLPKVLAPLGLAFKGSFREDWLRPAVTHLRQQVNVINVD